MKTHLGEGASAPAIKHYPITPGPDELSANIKCVYITVAGDVTVEDVNGASIIYTFDAPGLFPFRPTKITAATATVIGWE